MDKFTYCRTCGRDGLSCSLPLLHRSEVSSETVLRMIEFGMGMKVSSDDGYPQQVCRMCYGQILVSYELKRASIKSRSWFQLMFSQAMATNSAGEGLPPEENELERDMLAGTVAPLQEDVLMIQKPPEHAVERIPLKYQPMQRKRKIYRCKYCVFATPHRTDYMYHYRTHPKALRCVCDFVTDRKYTLRRHLANFKCEERLGKKVNWGPSRHQRSDRIASCCAIAPNESIPEPNVATVKVETEEVSTVDETRNLDEECLNPEDATTENAGLTSQEDRTESQDDEIETRPELLFAAIKLEPEDVSTIEGITTECSKPEHTEYAELEQQEEHMSSDVASFGHRTLEGRNIYALDEFAALNHDGKPNEEMPVILPGDQSSGSSDSKLHQGRVQNHVQLVLRRSKIFRCLYCSYTTLNRRLYDYHLKTHPKRFRCVCGLATDRKSNLRRHLEKFQCEKVYGRKVNWEAFKIRRPRRNETQTRSELESVQGESEGAIVASDIFKPDEQCSTSQDIMIDNSEQASELAPDGHNGEGLPYNQTDVGTELNFEIVKLEPNENSTIAELPMVTEECLKSEDLRSEATTGLVLQEGHAQSTLKIYKCKRCTYTSPSRMEYISHRMTHPNTLKCVCGFVTDRMFSLQRHQANFRCNERNYNRMLDDGTLSDASSQSGSKTTNETSETSPENQSGKTTKYEHRKGKKRSSRTQKVYRCQYCDYSSNIRVDYSSHLKMHPEAPQCVCGYTTEQRSNLLRHVNNIQCERIYGKKIDWSSFK